MSQAKTFIALLILAGLALWLVEMSVVIHFVTKYW
jgi:hypothetical protein